jgi:dTDP-4-amino-4,6-dideoxygalactose transaminase
MILLPHRLAPTPPELTAAERQLLDCIGGREVLWCGRGAAALCWAYRLSALARGCRKPEVILPATGCASLASTALACGVTPRFADVDPATGMPGLQDLQRACRPDTVAVLFVHLFGNTADLRAIRDWCRIDGLVLIEDVAQSLGAALPCGGPAGSMGDLVICSFSRTKLITSGGGALIVRSAELPALTAEAAPRMPLAADPEPALEQALESSYRDLQYGLTPLLRASRTGNLARYVLPLQPYYEPLWMRPLADTVRLAAGLAGLSRSLPERLQKAAIYARILQGGPWQLLDGWSASGVCWRFTLLLDQAGHQLPLAEAVRKDGFHVSHLYWPLTQLFSECDATPGAEQFARRVVNLWVDETVDRGWVSGCASSLVRHAREVCR